MEINRTYPCNRANYQGKRTQRIQYLVIHYVGDLGGARNNALYYHRDKPGISAHYFVGHADEGAAIYASVPEDCVASHCGRTDGRYKHPECRNANSIGIEMCCHQTKGGVWYFDRETVDKTVELARDIIERYRIPISHVLRHYDVTGKICPAPFVSDPGAWEDFKKRLEEPEMTQEEFNTMFEKALAAHEAALSAKSAAQWAERSWGKAKGKGVLDGTRPVAGVTRQELAVVADRLGLLE